MLKSTSVCETCDSLGWRLPRAPISDPKSNHKYMPPGRWDTSPSQGYPRHLIHHNPFLDARVSERTLNAAVMFNSFVIRFE